MVPLVPLIHTVVVFQVLCKGRGNVAPHNTQRCPLGVADGGTSSCKCFQLLHHRLQELQNTVVTDADSQDGLEKWDIPAKIQYTFYTSKLSFPEKRNEAYGITTLRLHVPFPQVGSRARIVMWETTLALLRLPCPTIQIHTRNVKGA